MEQKKSFRYGYLLNIFVGLMFFCYSALTVACMNITVPALFYGHVTSFVLYAILNSVIYACAVAVGTVMTGTLTANWFPRKRGWVLGFSSIGLPA